MSVQLSPFETRERTDSPLTTETSSSDTEYARFRGIFQKAFIPEDESKAGKLFDDLYQEDKLSDFIINLKTAVNPIFS